MSHADANRNRRYSGPSQAKVRKTTGWLANSLLTFNLNLLDLLPGREMAQYGRKQEID